MKPTDDYHVSHGFGTYTEKCPYKEDAEKYHLERYQFEQMKEALKKQVDLGIKDNEIVERVKTDYKCKKTLQLNFKGKTNKYDEIVELEEIFLGLQK